MKYALLKLASRCNLKCTYCYWFKDKDVYNAPPKLTIEAEDAFIDKLRNHVIKYKLNKFFILLHGGEPLLFGKARFITLVIKLKLIAQETQCKILLGMTTNGVLIDDEWAKLLKVFDVSITISIDGPEEMNDSNRIDLKGKGTYHKVVNAINLLRNYNIKPGFLAVCSPSTKPKELINGLVNNLRITKFDVLLPDANYETGYQSISSYYKSLFDEWLQNYADKGIQIRIIDSLIKGLLGAETHSHSIGYGPVTSLTILTDGAMEPVDVLRIAGHDQTKTSMSVFTSELQQITEDNTWLKVYYSSINLCQQCQECKYNMACGGGSLAHRWSKENDYMNPSVYCKDIKDIFSHIEKKIINRINYVIS